MVVALDTDELFEDVSMQAVNEAWNESPLEIRRRFFWPWFVYLCAIWLEVATMRTQEQHKQIRAEYRRLGVDLRDEPSWTPRPTRAPRPRQSAGPRVRPRPRTRRRPRAPPGDDEADPDPDDVDRARREWSV